MQAGEQKGWCGGHDSEERERESIANIRGCEYMLCRRRAKVGGRGAREEWEEEQAYCMTFVKMRERARKVAF